mmetsp:Transcript_466/g.821  ORF Transcript_466/g.821 Transcript_466/m.821 type:complete len:170 (-) Transcript_466:872-1381(-)
MTSDGLCAAEPNHYSLVSESTWQSHYNDDCRVGLEGKGEKALSTTKRSKLAGTRTRRAMPFNNTRYTRSVSVDPTVAQAKLKVKPKFPSYDNQIRALAATVSSDRAQTTALATRSQARNTLVSPQFNWPHMGMGGIHPKMRRKSSAADTNMPIQVEVKFCGTATSEGEA